MTTTASGVLSSVTRQAFETREGRQSPQLRGGFISLLTKRFAPARICARSGSTLYHTGLLWFLYASLTAKLPVQSRDPHPFRTSFAGHENC
ncbi:hypothetical protein K431DRAFT_69036 [Polychaeton citri CBS 116435]|uniref:Uncharacterized protein n=1 Tax=Polychaeton citri CBS 116435 TaxID=1314669 RepID=A0A9P4UMT3_9PEZI|nr:hypothetical protein K431DRAFT_69036 [Polychaeton citri CBS 116435]